MPGVEENRATWNDPSSWAAGGDEWSGPWGSSELLWYGTLLPRLQAYVPTETILELGPGHGRWAQYLQGLCERLILVDVAESCIDVCRERFAGVPHIEYHVNDGKSLEMVPDGAIDLVFSFDSLVHAERDVLEAYLAQLGRKLKPDGIGFIHHSNMGNYRRAAALARRIPHPIRLRLTVWKLLVNVYAWRADTTAEEFAALCDRGGLACIAQEKICWEHGRGLSDTLSLFTPRGSRWERPNRVVENYGFMREAARIAEIGSLYGRRAFSSEATRAKSST